MEAATQLTWLHELYRTGQPQVLPWDDRLITGLPEIDAEHRQLVELINRMGTRRAAGAETEELLAALNEFRSHTLRHFQHEAELMLQYAVSDAHRQMHQKAHQGFVECLDSVAELVNLNPAAIIDHLLNLLVKWLVFHIVNLDKRLADGINALRAGVPPEQAMIADETFEDTLVDTMNGLYAALGERTFELVALNCRLQESEERYRVLFEQAPDAIAIIDLDRDRFADANGAAERLFGCGREKLLQRSPMNFYIGHPQDDSPVADSIKNYNEEALAGGQPVFELLLRNADGRELHCEVRLVRLPAGRRRLIRASFIDIAERKRTEDGIRENDA